MSLIFVDVEGHGPAPGPNHDPVNFEFGAVDFDTPFAGRTRARETFHGIGANHFVFLKFAEWLKPRKPLVFVSDNVAYDWQFINYYFHLFLSENPFGHSGRRISDFYAGLRGDWRKTQDWKRWRKTKHDHNPVNDAMGNVEAFERILEIEQQMKDLSKVVDFSTILKGNKK